MGRARIELDRVARARELAQILLGGLPELAAHRRGGGGAEELAAVLGEDRQVLVAAAWLHLVGYMRRHGAESPDAAIRHVAGRTC